MRSALLAALAAVLVAGLAASPAGAQAPPGWATAVDARRDLGLAQAALMAGDRERALLLVERAGRNFTAADRDAIADLRRATERGDNVAFASARAHAWTALLHTGLLGAVKDARRGDAAAARGWLLVREFRAPTRFTRAGTDATVALAGLARGNVTPAAAARAVRADLLDTYDARLHATLQSARAAARRGFDVRLAEEVALARGYVGILADSYRSQRGVAAYERLETALAGLEGADVEAAVGAVERQLEGFRAVPLAPAEQARRAGQLDRFLRLVPIEYDRGVEANRVTLAFEIQEAISFRAAAAAALTDVAPTLLQRNASATRELTAILASLANALDAAGSGRAVAPAEWVSAQTERSLDLIDGLYPAEWKDAAAGADFDVIAASLDRLANAARAGSWSRAEQARLEAYGIFELGPEQRLRGIAPSLFQRIEGLFWYGDGDHTGLVQLVKRKDAGAELEATLAALDDELVAASQRVGTGANSTASVVSNSAIVVFREGLEAVLILAALMASMVGANRKYRRPLLIGVAVAFVASALTWVVAQTVLGSLAQYGERLEAVVSVIAIAVLLLILNWFYHRVYWAEHLAGFHQRKQRLLRGAGVGLVAAQAIGLAALGFSSVYREGFETVLFLQALTLEAGVLAVLPGVLLGLAATFAVGAVTILLERKLPHRKMLIATGILMTWVLVILVGTTVQTFQVVGWLPVAPIEGVQLPYWAGTWLGIYPTWQGVLAQTGAAAFVVGSYLAAEHVRARRRRRVLSSIPSNSLTVESGGGANSIPAVRRRLVLVLLALAAPSAAHAADLTAVPREFSPDEKRLSVHAELPTPERVGVQLATTAGKPVGWIAEPQRRRFLTLRWNGRLAGGKVPDGKYTLRLVDGLRVLAETPLTIDRIAPRAMNITAHNRGRQPFQGDKARVTTISPNGDRLRESAKISFTLSERAIVHFEVATTISTPKTIYELTANLKAGRNTFTWFPHWSIGPRTYLVRITTTDAAGNRRTYGDDTARRGRKLKSAVVRVLGVDAGFTAESYVAPSSARLAIETDAEGLTLQTFRAGPEEGPTHSDSLMNGVPVNQPVTIPWAARSRRATLNFAIGPWPTGVYFVKLTANDGRVGYAPFTIRPTTLGSTSRIAVVIPTNTWQAYNFRDADGNGWGDTWYAKGAQSTAQLGRMFLRRGVPPQWRKYDVGFLRWIHATGKQPEFITETDLEAIQTAEELIALYDFVIFPGHTEYVTTHEVNLIEGYRNLGGNLAFLSANNFFWEVRLEGRTLRRTRLWRNIGRPESSIIGVQYRANDDGRIQRPFIVRSATTAPWLWAGTGLGDGSVFGQELGGYGIEIDQATAVTPPGTIVLAEIPDLYGPGLTAQMTYYETPAGARVFAGGAIDFSGSAMITVVRRMLENLWARLSSP